MAHEVPFIRTFFVQHANHHFDQDTTNNTFELNYLITNAEEIVPTSLSIFPNPFTDFIQIADQTDLIQMDFYDPTGRKVSTGYDRSDNLARLPSGFYFLQIQTGSSTATTHVVKVE